MTYRWASTIHELGHITFIRCSQFSTDQGLGFLAIINCSEYCNCPFHVVCCQILQPNVNNAQ